MRNISDLVPIDLPSSVVVDWNCRDDVPRHRVGESNAFGPQNSQKLLSIPHDGLDLGWTPGISPGFSHSPTQYRSAAGDRVLREAQLDARRAHHSGVRRRAIANQRVPNFRSRANTAGQRHPPLSVCGRPGCAAGLMHVFWSCLPRYAAHPQCLCSTTPRG
jgi:hypothetical protein